MAIERKKGVVMGLSSNKTTTKSNQTQTGTTTPNAPDWLTNSLHGYSDAIGNFSQADPNSFVAGASPLQQQAFGNTGNLSNWQPQAATASRLAFGAGTQGANLAGAQPQVASPPQSKFFGGKETGGFLPAGGYTPPPSDPGYGQPRPGTSFNPALTGASQMGNYSNPYDQQVINTTLANYDANSGQSRAALEAAGARNHAFGGSRFGIAEGQFDASNAMNRAQTEAGLRQQGFNTAAGYGLQDANAGNTMNMFNAGQQDNALNRQLQAAGLLTDQSNAYDANTRADLGTMADLGGQQRAIQQDYSQAPLAQLLAEGQLYGQIPYNALVGQTINSTMNGTNVQKSNPSLFQMLLNGAGNAANAYAAGQG